MYCKIKSRTGNPADKKYNRYGGRGIMLCDEWNNSFESFYIWAMCNGYKKGLSIERVNNDGNYEPNNCVWATAMEQAQNTRRNKYLVYGGETKSVSQWARDKGIHKNTLLWRLNNGWSVSAALTTPVRTAQAIYVD